MFFQQLLNGVVLGSIYALIALGYTLVYGLLMMINFAHSEIFMLGAFAGLYAAHACIARHMGAAATFGLSMAAAMIAAGALGVFTERFAYRPLRHAPKLAPLISAIGMSIVYQNAGFLWVTSQTVSFPELVTSHKWEVAGVTITALQLLIFLTAIGLMVGLHLFTQKTKIGKAMRACADDLPATGLMGIDANKIIAATFLIGGALGGAAGVLYGTSYGSIKYNLGFLPGVKAFTAAVLGGIGNIAGAVLGGYVLGLLEVLAAGYLPNGAEWKDVIAFVVLIAVLLVRPSGILGERVAEKV
jgi:branched-chain amino acid transport system permease protein